MLSLLVAVLWPLAGPLDVSAHPLGNFTIDRYSRVTFTNDAVSVLYVLDTAEIPAFEILRRYNM